MTYPKNAIGWKPLDEDFDTVIMAMCKSVLPGGFDVGPIAPGTFEELVDHMRRRNRMLVWSGNSETTIYGASDVNFAFRAWHDFLHWQEHLPFTLAGEAAVAWEQVEQLRRAYPNHPRQKQWRALLFAEVIGQQLYNDLHGSFPANQRAFVKKFVEVLLEKQPSLPDNLKGTRAPSMTNHLAVAAQRQSA